MKSDKILGTSTHPVYDFVSPTFSSHLIYLFTRLIAAQLLYLCLVVLFHPRCLSFSLFRTLAPLYLSICRPLSCFVSILHSSLTFSLSPSSICIPRCGSLEHITEYANWIHVLELSGLLNRFSYKRWQSGIRMPSIFRWPHANLVLQMCQNSSALCKLSLHNKW